MSRRTIAERAWYDMQAFGREPVARIEQAISEAVGEHSCAEVVRHAVEMAIKQERNDLRRLVDKHKDLERMQGAKDSGAAVSAYNNILAAIEAWEREHA